MRPLDDFLPAYELSEQHSLAIDAPPARSDAALRAVSISDIPVARVLWWLRRLDRPCVHVADSASRRRFRRYWFVIRPFSGLIRVLLLRAAQRHAETKT